MNKSSAAPISLSPCPFCGEVDRLLFDGDRHPYVICARCGAYGPDADSIDAATQVWNQRIPLIESKLVNEVRAFIHWVARNEFTDPENMLVCAEWHALCEAVGEPITMAGDKYQ